MRRRRSAATLVAVGALLAASALAQTPPERPLTAAGRERPSYVYDGDGRLIGTARPSRGDAAVLLYGADGRFIGAARRRGRDLFLFDAAREVTDAVRPRRRVVLRRGPGGTLREVTREGTGTSFARGGERRESRRAPAAPGLAPQHDVERLDFGDRAGGVGGR